MDAVATLAFARMARNQPVVLLGGGACLAVLVFGLADRLGSASLTAGFWTAGAALVGALVGTSVGRAAGSGLEGPFGFVLARPMQAGLVALRRTLAWLMPVMIVVPAIVAWRRPEAWLDWMPGLLPAAAIGAAVGVVLGQAAGGLVERGRALIPVPRMGDDPRRRLVGQLMLTAGLLGAAWMAGRQGSEGLAQLLAVGAALSALAATAAVDPARLAILAATPMSMAQLVLPMAVRPALTGLIVGAAAGAVLGHPPAVALGMGLVLALVGGLARVFLTLAALGRSQRAARTAGTVELLIVGVLPFAGPLAIGAAAGVWVVVRLVWLWRRGVRVRWLDPENEW